ncbi:MAG: formate C-acetyltransferase [Clostridiales bacterium]|nr:formate C-acetyltransferase [Clostridiales bacterium]
MKFRDGIWKNEIDVRDFIVENYTEYSGDEGFLEKPTESTLKLWEKVLVLMDKENKNGGVLDIDEKTISTITSHKAGYIEKELETIVGLQTDKPLKRAILPFGGIRMVHTSLKAYNRVLPENLNAVFNYRKTHNDGVFDVYSEEMKKSRHSGIITGLPDAYGRGRIIGDYRRVPLYGVDRLIEEKVQAHKDMQRSAYTEYVINALEEISEQIKALNELKEMALSYGFDISKPANDTKEAIQWLYFAYLGATKEQNGAAMSLGRVSTFLDIYSERDLEEGKYTESQIQEFVDHFIMKLRLIRFLRTPAYDELFSGDPTWVTEAIGGMCVDGRSMVTKMSFRFLHTLINLGPAPEPNMTILWSVNLPEKFKLFAAKASIETSSIQYENDDIMRPQFNDDYGIACCVSAMRIGKQMQFFGARVNMGKALLYAINGGKDEISGEQVAPIIPALKSDLLDFDEVWERFDLVCDWLARLYINSLNAIHFMHDKYSYERLQMALHDEDIFRTMACGIAGLSVVADSLSAIKYAKVIAVRNADGMAIEFRQEGDFPKFGNNENKVDELAARVVKMFMKKLSTQSMYRQAKATMSILTITSNVVYGKKTGSTPDGRKAGEPFAPGANPMHGRDSNGSIASMMSVAKLPYTYSEDGISYTFSIIPKALGNEKKQQCENLASLLDGYVKETGHHINVNVLNREMLIDAMEHPEKYPQLTIRVSGYAVNFIRLPKSHQLEVINRTFHERF